MTQKDKRLLLNDLCARLPYGVKIYSEFITEIGQHCIYDGYRLHEISEDGSYVSILSEDEPHGACNLDLEISNVKPYLRPMSSMTTKESKVYEKTCFDSNEVGSIPTLESFDWLNTHHFDYRGLIEKGLALDAKPGMYD